jgi:delta 1-pyrroline-5-carboxylate dehydrogenase
VHPFGGFNRSGTDSKAGGRNYLLLFLQAKSIAEKVKSMFKLQVSSSPEKMNLEPETMYRPSD